MAIEQVRVNFNGQWYTLEYNQETNRYETYLTPEFTSVHQPGGYYNITAEATNDSGVVVTTDGSNIKGLRLYAKETNPPTISVVSPVGSYITTKQFEIVFDVTEPVEESGVNADAISLSVDGIAVSPEALTVEEIESGFRVSYRNESSIADGTHFFVLTAFDVDGNSAQHEQTYTIDTVPPKINVKNYVDQIVVDDYSVEISGDIIERISPHVAMQVFNSGVLIVENIVEDVEFSYSVPLFTGENRIQLFATDDAGLSSSYEMYKIRLVTDRKQSDVDEVNRLLRATLSGWTESEKENFLMANHKGSYNYTDLNRVVFAMAYLNDRFKSIGYSSGYEEQSYEWSQNDYFKTTDSETYLENVSKIRSLIPNPDGIPEVPSEMQNLTFLSANDIEKILVSVDSIVPILVKSNVYSNEFFSGEM